MQSDAEVQERLDQDFKKIESAVGLDQLLERINELVSKETSHVQVVSLVGGAGSGKTTLAKKMIERLPESDSISTDDYVIGTRLDRSKLEGKDPILKYDFDLLRRNVDKIREGRPVLVPHYDDASGIAVAAEEYSHRVPKVKTLIVEGDFHPLRDADVVLYLHVSDEVRLQNRIKRDTRIRAATDEDGIKENFLLRQRIQHIPYTLPVARFADLIIEGIPGEEYRYNLYQRK